MICIRDHAQTAVPETANIRQACLITNDTVDHRGHRVSMEYAKQYMNIREPASAIRLLMSSKTTRVGAGSGEVPGRSALFAAAHRVANGSLLTMDWVGGMPGSSDAKSLGVCDDATSAVSRGAGGSGSTWRVCWRRGTGTRR